MSGSTGSSPSPSSTSLYEQGPDGPKSTVGENIGAVIVSVVVIGLAVVIFRGLTASEDRFAVGDCLRFEEGKYKGESCDEQQAEFKVYAARASPAKCIGVPGTSSTYYEPTSKGGRNWYCIGAKNLDLAKAINDIKPDECIVVRGSAGAEKRSCDAPASRRVLKVLKDVLKYSVGSDTGLLPNECVSMGAKNTKLTYSWGLEDTSSPNPPIEALSWDRVLCLGS